jgi:transketolase
MAELIRKAPGKPVSMRKAYGHALVSLGRARSDVVVLSADVSNSDHSYMFEQEFPDRFFNVGIAEPALVDIAVGLAHSGKIPIANTFAFLFATRALEQVRTHLCYGKANVKLAGAYAGLSDSYDGPTHHSLCDLAVMRSLPNMTVVVPSDPLSLERLLPQIVDRQGPVFFRLCRNEVPPLFTESYRPRIGKAEILTSGGDVTILGCGVTVSRCLAAAERLEGQGISARVVELHTLKPLDSDTILRCAEETQGMVTVEEHSVIGGLGGAVAEVLAEHRPVPLVRVGIPDIFAESGPYEEIMDRYGLALPDILSGVDKVLRHSSGHR